MLFESESKEEGIPGTNTISRRGFLKMAGIAGAALGAGAGLGGVLAACGEEETTTTISETTTSSAAGEETTSTTVSAEAESGRALKIGVVSPQTGALALFGLADTWAIKHTEAALPDGIVGADGKKRMVEMSLVDTQSDTNRCSQVTSDLILNDKVDIVLAAGSPDTVVPAADQCEVLETPGLFNYAPWQCLFYRDTTPAEGYNWIYAYKMGSEQTLEEFSVMFDQVPNNKKVGMLFANDADAQAWMAENAAPAVFEAKGYELTVPDYYPEGAEDFTAQISAFKKAGVEILCGTNNPPSFVNFMSQAAQQGFKPPIVSSGKALLVPQVPEAMYNLGSGFIGEMAWSPKWPYTDSLTGMSCEEVAAEYESDSGLMWMSTIILYAKYEWAVDVFKRAADPEDKNSIVEAIRTTKLATIDGTIDFTQPVENNYWRQSVNCVRCPFAGGQWIKTDGGKYQFDFIQCSNVTSPETTVEATVKPMEYFT